MALRGTTVYSFSNKGRVFCILWLDFHWEAHPPRVLILCLMPGLLEADHGTQAEAQAWRFLREASRGLTAHCQPQSQALLRPGSMAGSVAETENLSVPSRLSEHGTNEKQCLASKFLHFALPRSGHTMLRKYSHSSTFHAAGGRASWQSCESTDLVAKTHPRNINSAGANPRPRSLQLYVQLCICTCSAENNWQSMMPCNTTVKLHCW